MPIVFLLLASVVGLAQQASGNLDGVIFDSTGAVVAGAEVNVVSTETGEQRTFQTDEAGRYRFSSLRVGEYMIKVIASGFAPLERKGVIVEVGRTVTLDLTLQVGSAGSEVVTIAADAPVVETTRTQVSSVVGKRAVKDLPVNGRNFQEFILLTPGVSPDPRAGDISFGGLRGTNNSLQIDGSDNNNTFFGQTLGRTGSGRAPYQFSKDAIREFQVNTNTYAAEYGRAGGAVINAVTKSGTNDFHGNAFLFFRDRSLNAEEPFAKAARRPKPRNRIYQYGATFSGPVVRDRTFFFFNFDGQRNSEPNPVFLPAGVTVPSDPASQEGFRKLQPFFGTYDRKFNQDVYMGKLDHRFSNSNQFSLRYNYQRFTGENLENAGPTSAFEHTGNSNVRTHTVTANLTTIVSPSVVNELRVQYARDSQPGFANSDKPEAVINAGPIQVIQIGRNNFSPRETTINRYQFIDSLSYTRGKHTYKFGVDFNIERILNFFPGLFSGSYTFTSFADFADGRPSGGYRQAFPGEGTSGAISRPNNFEFSFYVQDDWRLTNRLKLYYGVRYDLQMIRRPSIVNPDPQLAKAGIRTAGAIDQDTNNFAPRIGFAYSLTSDDKTVIRGGYGIFYSRTPSILTTTAITQNGIQIKNLFFPASNTGPIVYPFKFDSLPSGVTPSRPSIFVYDSNFVQPYVQQASLGIERELFAGIGFSATYLFVKGTKLPRVRDINLSGPIPTPVPVAGGGTITVNKVSPIRPLSNFNRIWQAASEASSSYNGLAVQLTKKYANNLQFLMSYTYSKVLDDKPDATTVVVGVDDFKVVSDQLNPGLDRGPGESDVRHRFVLSGLYDLNIATAFGSDNSVAKAIFDGYTLSGIFTASSGRPFSATVAADLNGDGNVRNDRVPFVGRNTIFGPSFYQLDMRLQKSIRTSETTKIDLIVEAFNLFNRTNVTAINTNQFLLVNGVLTPNRAFKAPTNSAGAARGANRQFQLALQFEF
ncbi:MAG: TonB-dependent receptor [Acidobacteriota bacterium]|nr:TonB-dependent receptor [Blastocatellia bacterium]MDW8412734.1 TonB-dependent receptor [Acidobacteriota bacterium]